MFEYRTGQSRHYACRATPGLEVHLFFLGALEAARRFAIDKSSYLLNDLWSYAVVMSTLELKSLVFPNRDIAGRDAEVGSDSLTDEERLRIATAYDNLTVPTPREHAVFTRWLKQKSGS